MVRYATVGTSWITDSFIRGGMLVEGLSLKAVYSREREKGIIFGANYGVNWVFTDLEEMASSDDLDAVYIASPNRFHYEQSKLFLEHGKHVICEKPITVTSKELMELQALAEKKGLVYQEAMMMAHLPAREILREAVGRIGKVSTAHFDFSQLSSKYPAFLRGEVPNIFKPEMATGCLMDLGIYCVYPVVDLFGEPDSILASAGFLSTGADGYGGCIFQYPDKQVTLTYSKIGQSRLGSQILGDKGTIVLPSVSQLTNMRLIFKDGREEMLTGEMEKHRLMGAEAEHFQQMITTTGQDRELCQLALRVSRVMEQIRKLAGIQF